MNKPEEPLEIYLTAGEFHFGDAETRVRTLLGEGGVITLWHPRRRVGAITHFRSPRRAAAALQLDPAYADEALAMLMLEMGRLSTRPREFIAKLFVHDSPGSARTLEQVSDLLDLHGIHVKVEHIGAGNLVFDIWNGEVWMQQHTPAVAKAGKSPDEILEVYLNPGDWHFGDEDTRIKTLLGSCVSFTLWHPGRKIGGMCHYMLPSRGGKPPPGELNGKYADEALQLLVQEIEKEDSRPRDFIAKVFGGGSMLESGTINVSDRNVETARELINHYGFRMEGECLGGVGHRNVIFDVWSGEVWLKKSGK